MVYLQRTPRSPMKPLLATMGLLIGVGTSGCDLYENGSAPVSQPQCDAEQLTSVTTASQIQCPCGGTIIASGSDDNCDGILEASEVTASNTVCADLTCTPVPLTSSTQLPVGNTQCPYGGTEIDSGVDYNVDGTLEASEITSRSYLCNLACTVNQLFTTTALPLGDANCPCGGSRIDTGLDDGDGGGTACDGVLQPGEVTATSYSCVVDNSGDCLMPDPPPSLVATTSLPVGDANCPYGGTEIETGLDNGDGGGIANDGVLEPGEIDSTQYICQGEPFNGVDAGVAPADAQTVAPTADVTTLVADDSQFALSLYQAIRGQSGNLFFSPHSISTTLAMAYAGAENNTASQMASALSFTLPDTQLNPAFDQLDLSLATSGANAHKPFHVSNANALWGQTGFPFRSDFLTTLATNYGASMNTVDFADDPAGGRTAINTWAAAQTNNKITDLLPPNSIDATTRLILTNAVYFQAGWASPFLPSTTTLPFTTADGTQVTAQVMNQTFDYINYTQSNGTTAIDVPYDGYQLSMVIIMPDDFASFESTMNATTISSILASLSGASVELTMPKFNFTSPSISLKSILVQMGMVDAFNPDAADFTGMYDTTSPAGEPLHVSDVVHKAFVAVDENGTEAAAVTAVLEGGENGANGGNLRSVFTVDHPFIFLIRDNNTGAIIFLGRVVDPTE